MTINTSGFRQISQTLSQRFLQSWKYALAAAVALTISWNISQGVFGHSRPLFASITALICLVPGIPSHIRQAGSIILGVTTGILIGELVLLAVPDTLVPLRFIVASFAAMMIACLYGMRVVVVIQAGVSSMLVMVMGPVSAGPDRMIDVLVGLTVGLFFSQVLITPDPVRQIDEAARNLMAQMSKGFRDCLKAIRTNDIDAVSRAQSNLASAHDRLIALGTGISSAKDSARWSIRGRMAARRVNQMAGRHNRHALRLYASTLLFADSLYHGLRDDPENMPADMTERTEHICAWIEAVVAGDTSFETVPEPFQACNSPQWQAVNDTLHAVGDALASYQEIFVVDKQAAAESKPS